MERPHQPKGGETAPPVNSYGSDEPETQAHTEHARVEAARERRRNRLILERLGELGLNPADAEVLIEFDDAMRQAPADGEHFRPTSLEDTRRDLADLLSLRDHPRADAALAAFAADLRKDVGSSYLTTVPPLSITAHQVAGLDRRDALIVAGFEYYLRYKLASAGDSAASLGVERYEQQPAHLTPRIHVVDHRTVDGDESRSAWIDTNQPADELEAAIAETL
jgi:hypothetical protein